MASSLAAPRTDEHTGRFALLTVTFAVGFSFLLYEHVDLAVAPPVLAAMLVPWLGLTLLLQTHKKTWGREGKHLDLWSISHTFAGVLLWSVGIGLWWVVLIAIAWELVETASRVSEHPANRWIDVALAMGGWLAANAISVWG